MDTDKQSPIKSIINLRRIVLGLSLVLIVLAFFSLGAIRKQAIFEEQNAESVAKMQKQVTSLTEANHQLTFELEQLKGRDTMASIDEVWRRKFDSIERLNFYNSVLNHVEALNESTLTKAREDSQKLYDDYLTHINTIIAFFSIIIAAISIFVPYLINRKTDDAIKEHDDKINEIVNQINTQAESAKQSAIQSEASSLFSKALSSQNKGDFDDAIEYYSKAIDLNPNFVDAYNNRGVVYAWKLKFDDAIKDFEKSVELNPKNVESRINCGSAYRDKRMYDEAFKNFNMAIELNPKEARIYNERGYCYLDIKDWPKAKSDFDKAIELSPENSNYYDSRAEYYMAIEDYKNAMTDIEKGLSLNPKEETRRLLMEKKAKCEQNLK